MEGWQIVKFPDEDNTVEAVPSSWIHSDENGFKCYWPPSISNNKVVAAIKGQKLPEANWITYTVTLITPALIYSDFLTASRKANRAQYTSGLDTTDGEEDCSNKRPKRRNPRYASFSDEEYSPIRKSPRFKLPTPPNLQSPTVSKVQHNLTKKQSLSQPSHTLKSKESAINNADERSTTEEHPGPPISTTEHFGQPLGNSTSNISFNKTADFGEVVRLLHIINGRVHQNTQLITTILNNQSNMVQSERENKEESNSNVELKLPAETSEELIELDSLLDDDTSRKLLIKKFVFVGGDSIKDVVKRILPRLVTDEVLKEYSWIGGKGKKKFALLNNLRSIINETVKQNSVTKKECTEKAIEQSIALFLSKATERCTRKMVKNTTRNGDVL